MGCTRCVKACAAVEQGSEYAFVRRWATEALTGSTGPGVATGVGFPAPSPGVAVPIVGARDTVEPMFIISVEPDLLAPAKSALQPEPKPILEPGVSRFCAPVDGGAAVALPFPVPFVPAVFEFAKPEFLAISVVPVFIVPVVFAVPVFGVGVVCTPPNRPEI